MKISIFPDRFGKTVERHDVAWSDIVTRCMTPPKHLTKSDCPLIKLATFGDTLTPLREVNGRMTGGAIRNDANMVSVCGVEGDYDGEVVTPDTAISLLQMWGIRAVIYTSPSHRTDAPRWRVLAPLSVEHPVSDRRKFIARINYALGGILAGESFTDSQSYYFDSVSGVDYACIESAGECIDSLMGIGETYPIGATVVQRLPAAHDERTDADLSELRDALRSIPADDRDTWQAMGHALCGLGDDGYALWMEWSATSDKHNPTADARTWGLPPSKPARPQECSAFRSARC